MGTEKTDIVTESSHLVNKGNLVKIGVLTGAAVLATALFSAVVKRGNESNTDTTTTES